MALGDERGWQDRDKGKSVAGASSSAAAARKGGVNQCAKGVSLSSAAAERTRSMTTNNDVEVVTYQGKCAKLKIKLKDNIENTWSHGDPNDLDGFKCHYCVMALKSGGVGHLREHLGGIKGQVAACPNVPLSVRALMGDEYAICLAMTVKSRNGSPC